MAGSYALPQNKEPAWGVVRDRNKLASYSMLEDFAWDGFRDSVGREEEGGDL